MLIPGTGSIILPASQMTPPPSAPGWTPPLAPSSVTPSFCEPPPPQPARDHTAGGPPAAAAQQHAPEHILKKGGGTGEKSPYDSSILCLGTFGMISCGVHNAEGVAAAGSAPVANDA